MGRFPQDDPVLTRAAEIGRAHRARLTIVHVIDSFTGVDAAPADLELALIQQQTWLIARENVEAAVVRQQVDISEIEMRIEIGSPSLRLIELSDEINADLVVMRAHQSESILEKIIGSTTDRVIRVVGAPVLVLKRPVTQVYRDVVMATDMQEESGEAVVFAAALLPLAGLQLVHVVQTPPQLEEAMLRAGSGQATIADHRGVLMRKAKVYLRNMSKRLANRPILSTTRVIAGDPAKSLVRATRNQKVDLIALVPGMTGGRCLAAPHGRCFGPPPAMF